MVKITIPFLRELKTAMENLYQSTFELVKEMGKYSDQFNTEHIVDIYLNPKLEDKVTVVFFDDEKDYDDEGEPLQREYNIPFYYYENDEWKQEFEEVMNLSFMVNKAKEEES